MSADQQRLNSAIQNIAEQSPRLRELLKANENKGGKASAAGIGVSEAEEARICCDGSISDNANPGSTETDPEGDGAGQAGGLNSDDPARLDSGEGVLSGVTDCATGEPICFSGSGFIPPDGWDAPNDPPVDPTYEEGFYWTIAEDQFGVTCCTIAPTESLSEDKRVECGIGFGEPRKRQCPPPSSCSDAQKEYACNPKEEDILANGGKWPSDGCTNLAIVGGKIVGSKYDPENDGSYSAPRDSIDLCSGGDQISLAPSGSSPGGWKTINSTNDSGYLYDSSGKVIAHIDGTEYSDPAI